MKRITFLILILTGGVFALAAQNAPANLMNGPVEKDHAWEIGLHGGHFFTDGNVDFSPGYGGGIHLRRALDYVFSLRLDLMYGSAKGEDPGNTRNFSNKFYSGSVQAIATLNNLKWNTGLRKNNIFVLAGFGINGFEAELERSGEPSTEKVNGDAAAFGEFGAGISFKINERINIGLEHKAMITFGSRGDLLDGVQTFVTTDDRSTFHDIANYTSVRLNFNLGKADEKTEPLYWLNPMDAIIADITKLKDTRVTFNDSDGDGVIDMLDEEENTPEGAPVNVKGIALDSDGDGLKDYEDKEPYSPSKDVDDEGVAKTPDVMAAVEKLVNEKLAAYQPKTTETVAPPFSFWYLPTIYFDVNQTKIRPVDLGTLATVADVMKANPNLKFVVAGHADPTGSEEYNNKLSYQRAKAVVDYLVEKGVDRSQLILVWKGEKENLAEGINEINRRVAIRVATNETEMAPPTEN